MLGTHFCSKYKKKKYDFQPDHDVAKKSNYHLLHRRNMIQSFQYLYSNSHSMSGTTAYYVDAEVDETYHFTLRNYLFSGITLRLYQRKECIAGELLITPRETSYKSRIRQKLLPAPNTFLIPSIYSHHDSATGLTGHSHVFGCTKHVDEAIIYFLYDKQHADDDAWSGCYARVHDDLDTVVKIVEQTFCRLNTLHHDPNEQYLKWVKISIIKKIFSAVKVINPNITTPIQNTIQMEFYHPPTNPSIRANHPMFKKLLEQQKTLAQEEGANELVWAILKQKTKFLQHLLKDLGVDPNTPVGGIHPLFYLIERARMWKTDQLVEILDLLLEFNVDSGSTLFSKSCFEQTPLELLLYNWNYSALKNDSKKAERYKVFIVEIGARLLAGDKTSNLFVYSNDTSEPGQLKLAIQHRAAIKDHLPRKIRDVAFADRLPLAIFRLRNSKENTVEDVEIVTRTLRSLNNKELGELYAVNFDGQPEKKKFLERILGDSHYLIYVDIIKINKQVKAYNIFCATMLRINETPVIIYNAKLTVKTPGFYCSKLLTFVLYQRAFAYSIQFPGIKVYTVYDASSEHGYAMAEGMKFFPKYLNESITGANPQLIKKIEETFYRARQTEHVESRCYVKDPIVIQKEPEDMSKRSTSFKSICKHGYGRFFRKDFSLLIILENSLLNMSRLAFSLDPHLVGITFSKIIEKCSQAHNSDFIKLKPKM